MIHFISICWFVTQKLTIFSNFLLLGKNVSNILKYFQAIIESEECLERVACDVGALASDAGLDTSLASMASIMVPGKYSKYAKSFASAKNCSKIKCGSLF